jgi:hypothetical protein
LWAGGEHAPPADQVGLQPILHGAEHLADAAPANTCPMAGQQADRHRRTGLLGP